MEKILNLQIDVKKAGYNIIRGLKQGDNNSVLNVTLTQNSLPFDLTNLTVRANYKRPDSHIFLQETSIIDAKKGQIKINILTQALAFAGEVLADLSIFEGDRKITSVSFSMFVDASVYRNDYLDPEQLDIIQKVFVNEVRRNGETSKITEDYLKYKNIMTAESNVAALQNNIDKITAGIGGRNLIVDSLNLHNHYAFWNFEGTIQKLDDVYPASKKCFKVECTKANTIAGGGGFYFSDVGKNLKPGKTYTWSCYIFSKTTKKMNIGYEETGGRKEFVIGMGWKKISHTWTFNTQKSFTFYTADNWNVGDIMYVADLQIEEGTVPSTWTPAPEDMAEKSHTHLETDITGGFTEWALPNGYKKLPGGMVLQWGTIKTDSNSTGQTTGLIKLYDSWTQVKLPIKYEQFFRVFTNNQRFNGWTTGKDSDTGDKFDLWCTSTEGFDVVTGIEVSWFTIGY